MYEEAHKEASSSSNDAYTGPAHDPAALPQVVLPIGSQSQAQAAQTHTDTDPAAGIPSVKPIVDLHDKYWAETDVLDDIDTLAEQAKRNKSFFGEKHAEALQKLRASQIELAKVMASGSKKHEMASSRLLWGTQDFDTTRENIFGKDRFEEIDRHLKDTVEKLDTVAEHMREVDEQSRDFWSR